MIVRDAVEADLPAIVEILQRCHPGRISTAQLDPVSVEERLPWFREHSPASHPLWVAAIDGQIGGWLSFHPFITRPAYRGTAEISVYVNEKFRRRGIGRRFSNGLSFRLPVWRLARWSAAFSATTSQVCGCSGAWDSSAGGSCRASRGWMKIERDLVMVGRHLSKA